MKTDFKKAIYTKLTSLENEIVTLRENFLVTNKKYSETLLSIRAFTKETLEAAIRRRG